MKILRYAESHTKEALGILGIGLLDAYNLLVSACDNLHNARSIASDLKTIWLRVSERCEAGR